MNQTNEKILYDYIIPVGHSCNISFLLQNCKLKKETSLFEWFLTRNLNSITNVLNIISKNGIYSINLYCNNNNVFINDNNIYSSHYSLDKFKSIYERRCKRLLDIIKNNKKILFIRFEDKNDNLSYEDVDNFQNAIKNINNNCEEMKLLFITPNKNDLNLKHPFLITEYYSLEDIRLDPMFNGEKVNNFFQTTLKNIGINMDDKSDIIFTDKSDF